MDYVRDGVLAALDETDLARVNSVVGATRSPWWTNSGRGGQRCRAPPERPRRAPPPGLNDVGLRSTGSVTRRSDAGLPQPDDVALGVLEVRVGAHVRDLGARGSCAATTRVHLLQRDSSTNTHVDR